MSESKTLSCSELTKKKIAKALKELMANTAFDRITVSDITDKSRIHRQTFYYHFQDRYELLDWLLYDELIHPLIDGFNFDNMYDKLYTMFLTMSIDKNFYQNAVKINADDLSRYISRVAIGQFTGIIKELGDSMGLGENTNDEDDIVLAEFVGYGISGIVLGWAQNGMKESPETMTKRIENIVCTCKKLVLLRMK